MDYKKIYCDKWRAAYTSNTVVEKDNIVELHWKQVPLGWMTCGPKGVVFTKLYRFKGDPELTKICAFPEADKYFNALLQNVGTLESICQMWEEVETDDLEIALYCNGMQYGSIRFNNGSVTYEGKNGNGGWNVSDDPEVMKNYGKYILGKSRDVAIMDDMMLISELGSMIKR